MNPLRVATRNRMPAAVVAAGIGLMLVVPAGSAAAFQVLVIPDQGGGLVVDRQGSRLVMATSWRESEGTCFVGTRRGGAFRGTMTALPGPASASVRLRWARAQQGRRLTVRTTPQELYSPSVRRWKPVEVPTWRRVVGFGKEWTPSRALRGC